MNLQSSTITLVLMLLLISAGVSAQVPAFPGAEGAGKYTIGGRGGKVLYVTSLEDSNEPGTLRWAVAQKGTRTILFQVSGQIRLKSPLRINNGYLTIAGQSAPGDGICISDYETIVSADNVIIRFLRFRLGDETKRAVDALSGYRNENIIIDHCSMSWAIDELSSFYDNKNFTMQWCFITESLKNSVHGKGKHGYGGIWGGHNASFHHNLFAHNDSRNPRFCGSRYSNQSDQERVDFRNNVIYNWGSNNIYAAEGGSYNVINNYYKYGPASNNRSKKRLINPDADNGENKQPAGTYGRFFLTGNYLDGSPEITADNSMGIEMGSTFTKFAPDITLKDIIAREEFSFLPVTTDKAQEAYEKVLEYGGCALVRDVHDLRYVDNVKNRSYSFEGSAGSTHGLIDSHTDVGGWPEYKTYNSYTDSDNDGIPDGWLEKNYPGKKSNELHSSGYTYLEIYLNSLVNHLMGGNSKVFPFCTRSENEKAEVEFKEDRTGEKIDVFINNLFFTSFIYPETLKKPCLYPILTPSGKFITRGYPLDPRPYERVDHPHHVGLWFNFGNVNGLDFWNNSSAIAPERKKEYGSIRLDSIIELNSQKGKLTTLSSWVDYQEEKLLSEKTTYIFSGVGNEYRFIERTSQLTAEQEVTFRSNKEGFFGLRVDRAFETPEDKPVKRLDVSTKLAEEPFIYNEGVNGVYRNREGLTGEAEVWGKRTPWVALRAQKEGEIITLVILDHEQNPNYPGWPHARGYGLFSMNNLGGDGMDKSADPIEIRLESGESISFRHKLVIGGDLSDEEINNLMYRFNKQ